jgi:hypothetical protein
MIDAGHFRSDYELTVEQMEDVIVKQTYKGCLLSIRSEVRVLSRSPSFSPYKSLYLAKYRRKLDPSQGIFLFALFCGNMRSLWRTIRSGFVVTPGVL